MEETIILEKVKAGDAAAFSLLYDLYWLKVYNFARLYVTSSSVISEVVQDVFALVLLPLKFGGILPDRKSVV